MARPVAVVVALLVLVGTVGAVPSLPTPAPQSPPAGSALAPETVADPETVPESLASSRPATVPARRGVAGESPVGASQSFAVPAQLSPPNTTGVLLLADSARGAVYSPSPDVSTTLSADRAVTAERIARESLRTRYAAASGDERLAVLNATLDRLERRTSAARAELRRTQRQYANASLSPSDTAQRLARLDASASAIATTLSFVQSRANERDAAEIRARASALERRLVPLRGPVREQLSATMAGADAASRTYIAGTESGFRLGAVENGVHYHETTRNGPVGTSSTDPATIEEVKRRLSDLYPWAWNASQGTSIGVVGANTYRATIEHPHGSLTTYLDGPSLTVVREVQRRSVADLPTGPSVSTTRGRLRVAVNRTYAGGPLRVAVTEGDRGVNTTVRVEDVVVGRTGSDGVIWTVAPDGGTDNLFIVTAERGNQQVSLIVQPLQDSGA